MRYKILLSFLLIPSLLMAQCENAIHLLPGATNDGCERVGLSVPYEKQIRTIVEKFTIQQAINQAQADLISATKASLAACSDDRALIKADDDRERTAYDKERARTRWDFWGGVIAGFGAALLGAYIVKSVK